MRGKDILSFADSPTFRITPAHAGKSVLKIRGVNVKKDHPRTCGEKYGLASANLAGKKDHPRTCGEKFAGGST